MLCSNMGIGLAVRYPPRSTVTLIMGHCPWSTVSIHCIHQNHFTRPLPLSPPHLLHLQMTLGPARMLEKERNRPLFLFSLSNSENDVSFMSCTITCTLAWANFILLDMFSLFAFGNNCMVQCEPAWPYSIAKCAALFGEGSCLPCEGPKLLITVIDWMVCFACSVSFSSSAIWMSSFKLLKYPLNIILITHKR